MTLTTETGGPTGHTYELVRDTAVNWSDAAAAATAQGGYLVTITSAAEQAFVEGMLSGSGAGAGSYYIGLTKPTGVTGTPGGVTAAEYKWVTGESTAYQHWLPSPAQPDNEGGNETVGSVLWNLAGDGTSDGRSGYWNDLPDPYGARTASYTDLRTGGYVIELGGFGAGGVGSGDGTGTGGVGSGSGSVGSGNGDANAVPLPPAALAALPLMGLVYAARRRMVGRA